MKEFDNALEELSSLFSFPETFSFKGKAFDKNLFFSFDTKKGKACFIDGGNQDILVSPHVKLVMIRAAASFYDGVNRVNLLKNDGFFLISAKGVSSFGLDISIDDVSLEDSLENSSENLRRALERDFVSEGDFLMVRDGPLDDRGDVGIWKTNSLLTDEGNSFVSLIFSKAFDLRDLSESRWAYGPFDEEGEILRYIVKFHPNSDYAFVVDVRKGIDVLDALSIISLSSKDPVFLGYPYGLIDADIHARISNLEVRYFKSKLYEKVKNVSDFEHNSDAHAILDSISYS